MKKRKKISKSQWVTIGFFLVVGLIIVLSLIKPTIETDEEIAMCIGEKSTLYVQLGCSHCADQEELFGDNIQYVNIIDCYFERESCVGITATPTWVVNGEQYLGKKSIKELQELTGC